jgi:hypothetical protein
VVPLTLNTSKDDLNLPTTSQNQQFSTEPPVPLVRNPVQTVSSSVATPPTAAATAVNSPIDDGKRAFGLQEAHEPEPYKLDQLLFGM